MLARLSHIGAHMCPGFGVSHVSGLTHNFVKRAVLGSTIKVLLHSSFAVTHFKLLNGKPCKGIVRFSIRWNGKLCISFA